MSTRSILAVAGAALLAGSAVHAAELAPKQQAAVCQQRASCEIAAVTPAGSDAKGGKLTVVEVRLGLADKPEEAPEEGCISQNEDGGDNDGGHEYWLLRGGDAPVRLMALCNDGYGASGVGWDEVTVGKNRLVHVQEGGSAWRWRSTSTYSLSPFRSLAERDCSFHTLTPWSGTLLDIDYDSMQARSVKWRTGDAAAMDDEDTIGCPDWPDGPFGPTPGDAVYGALVVPAPQGEDATPLPRGTALGDCALTLRSDGTAGFLVHGKAAAPEDAAEVRVVAIGYNRLVAQVFDPTADPATAAAAGKSWIHAPHLEVWTSEEAPFEEGQPPAKLYHQVGVGLDGAVNAGAGEPALPKAKTWAAQDEQGRPVTVLDLAWDDEYALLDGLGVVYSQSAGGKQARLVANAGIVKNKPLFLPAIWSHGGSDGDGGGPAAPTCAIHDGLLAIDR